MGRTLGFCLRERCAGLETRHRVQDVDDLRAGTRRSHRVRCIEGHLPPIIAEADSFLGKRKTRRCDADDPVIDLVNRQRLVDDLRIGAKAVPPYVVPENDDRRGTFFGVRLGEKPADVRRHAQYAEQRRGDSRSPQPLRAARHGHRVISAAKGGDLSQTR